MNQQDTLLAKLASLADLEDNWDSYKALAIKPECIVAAERWLRLWYPSSNELDKMRVEPGHTGSVFIAWEVERDGVTLEYNVEFVKREKA